MQIDPDDDNDGCLDEEDPWPYNENACADSDGDGIADYYDSDKDNDGISDERDAFPNDPSEPIDTDGDIETMRILIMTGSQRIRYL